jgi:hypothetical protein
MSDYRRRHGAAFALYHKKIRGCSPAPLGPVGRQLSHRQPEEFPGLADVATIHGSGTVARNASQSTLLPQLRKRYEGYEGNIPRS